jgi:ATP-binding cassette subfamily B protein
MVALVNYLTQILLALAVIVNLTVIFARTIASHKRIRSVFSLPKEECNETGLCVFDKTECVPAVEYCGVSFGYKGDKNIIENLSFQVENGGRMCITGSTGSGKSSLLLLMPRLYRQRKGMIKLYGKDINEYSVPFLRERIKIASGNPVLFLGTVRDNIKADSNASDDEIEAAVKIACAESFAYDLNKEILAGGVNLSRGQKQRMGIARALIGRPDILLLDDALSALDNITALKVADNVLSFYRESGTVFIVTRNPKVRNMCGAEICLDY